MCVVKKFVFMILFSVRPLVGGDLEHALVSIYAVHCGTGKVLMDQNSERSLIPASCMKVVTTAAALHVLGAGYRFETHLEYDGHINQSILHGNIYISGGGDPCLGSDRIVGSLPWKQQIETWADAIHKMGVQKIRGKIIGDASRWEKALAVPSWEWEDLGNYYGAGACALTFHENLYSLYFKPAEKVGDPAQIVRTEPPLEHINFHNEVTTGPEGSGDQACIYGSEFSPHASVRGTIPAQIEEFTIKGSIPDPPAFCAALLTKELSARGITVDHENLEQPATRFTLHTTYSPTLGDIVYWANQKSINLYTEHLLKKMGETSTQMGSTASGIDSVARFLEEHHIDSNGLHIADGCGLSRKNFLTVQQLVVVLLLMKKSEHFPVFYDSLPQITENIRAKSGSQSFIRGYAGYVGEIAFAILINNCLHSEAMIREINFIFNQLIELSHVSPAG